MSAKIPFKQSLISLRHETYTCKSVQWNSRNRSTGTPCSHCRRVSVPSDTCTRSMRRRKSSARRSWYCDWHPASRRRAANAGTRSEDSRGCIRRRSTTSFGLRREPRNFVLRCNYLAGPCPTSASPRYHLRENKQQKNHNHDVDATTTNSDSGEIFFPFTRSHTEGQISASRQLITEKLSECI